MEIPTPIKYCTAHAQHVMHTRIHIAAIKIILCAEINNNDVGMHYAKKNHGNKKFFLSIKDTSARILPLKEVIHH